VARQQASPDVYRQGTGVSAVATPWGKLTFLICGDLFDENVAAQARRLSPDWVLFPFARCFTSGGVDQDRWDREELPAYVARLQSVGAPALMVNYLADCDTLPEDNSFGGAFVALADGTIHARMPLGAEGLLLVDTP
jgi:predicted amidohydrolase